MAFDMLAVDSFEEARRLISFSALLVALLVFVVAWFLREPAKSPRDEGETSTCSEPGSPQLQVPVQGLADVDLSKPNLLGTFLPADGRVIQANAQAGFPFDNDFACGIFLPMHRPTHDKALDKSGKYRYSDHFHGRKRLWEMRWQMQFKHDVTEPMRFGIELDEYVPLNAATKRLMGITVAALRSVAGSDLYHSAGDDPKKAGGKEVERPVFTMPMWAFDQFMVTPVGETPPSISDPNFHEFGFKRAAGRSEFIKEMTDLELRAGPTYTFAFWGISQFLDDINWRLQKVVPFQPLDFNLFCGAPPVHLVLYTMPQEDSETRHLQSRKQYYFRLAFWSSLKPPSPSSLRKLLSKDGSQIGTEHLQTAKVKGFSRRISGLFACCASQRPSEP